MSSPLAGLDLGWVPLCEPALLAIHTSSRCIAVESDIASRALSHPRLKMHWKRVRLAARKSSRDGISRISRGSLQQIAFVRRRG